MAEENELYTDYALQIFSTFISEDLNSMHSVLESFKNDGKSLDVLFMPGVIYGLMYHMNSLLQLFSIHANTPVEVLLSSYAMDYAIEREELLDNNILNVAKARKSLDELMQNFSDISNIDDWLEGLD